MQYAGIDGKIATFDEGELSEDSGILLNYLEAKGLITRIDVPSFPIEFKDDEPEPEKYSTGPIKSMMLTPAYLMPDLMQHHGDDFHRLRDNGFTHIYGCLDLVLPQYGGRPFIEQGRSDTEVYDLVFYNMDIIRDADLKCMITCCNEPSVRAGQGHGLVATDFRDLSVDQLYSDMRLEEEKQVIDHLVRTGGPDIIVPYLEPSTEASVAFCYRLWVAAWEVGHKGRVLNSGIGKGAFSLDPTNLSMTSLNTLRAWNDAQEYVRSSDGWRNSNANDIAHQVDTPGPGGVNIWVDKYAYVMDKPGVLEDWMMGV